MSKSKRNDLIALIPYDACGPAQEWLAKQKGTPKEAWEACPRGDWLLWLVVRLGVPGAQNAAFACADLTVRVFAADAMDAAKLPEQAATLRALPTIVDMGSAAEAARAAESAARAARAARAAAGAWAWAAAESAARAAWAAESAARAAAEQDAHKRCAGIVRKHVRWIDVKRVLAKNATGRIAESARV